MNAVKTRRLSLVLFAGMWACFAVSASACDSGGPDGLDAIAGKYEMYLNDQTISTLEVTFLKGRACATLSVNDKSAAARTAIVAFAEAIADSIPLDGSSPSTDAGLVDLVPGSGEIAGWHENLSSDTFAGPRLITSSAADWANGGVAPFDDQGFEAVALESYANDPDGWNLALSLLYMRDVGGADAAFHYRATPTSEDPYWDRGEQLH